MIKSKLPAIVTQWVDLAVDCIQLEVDPHTSVTRADAVAMLLRAIAKGPEFSAKAVVHNTMPDLTGSACKALTIALGGAYCDIPLMIRSRLLMQISQSSMADVQAELCEV